MDLGLSSECEVQGHRHCRRRAPKRSYTKLVQRNEWRCQACALASCTSARCSSREREGSLIVVHCRAVIRRAALELDLDGVEHLVDLAEGWTVVCFICKAPLPQPASFILSRTCKLHMRHQAHCVQTTQHLPARS